MIERLIYAALKSGVDEFTARPDAIVEFFMEQHEVPYAEAAEIRDFLLEHTPDIRHGYARSDAKFPCMAIVLGDERTNLTFLGDEGGFVETLGDEDFGADERAMMFGHTFNILIYARHPDVALYYYELAKFWLLGQLDWLKSYGLYEINFAGSDMAPDDKYIPAGLFLRRFTLTCSKEYKRVVPATQLGRAWKVAGIHVSADGAPGEYTGTKTLVTPYDGEDDAEG